MSDTESEPVEDAEVAPDEPVAVADAAEAAAPASEPEAALDLSNLPPEVAEALSAVLTALENFDKTAPPLLNESRESAAEAKESGDPGTFPDAVAGIEQLVCDLTEKMAGHTELLTGYLARVEHERKPVDEYVARLKQLFDPAAVPAAADGEEAAG